MHNGFTRKHRLRGSHTLRMTLKANVRHTVACGQAARIIHITLTPQAECPDVVDFDAIGTMGTIGKNQEKVKSIVGLNL
jgi:hypothetical protein